MADPAVWITGTGTNKQLNFRLPTGGKGDKGDKGDRGADGSNVLPTDTAIAAAINGTGTATKTALTATYAPSAGGSFAAQPILAKLRANYENVSILVVGDSTGFDGGANTNWPAFMRTDLAAQFPAYTVLRRAWNETTNVWDAAATVATGTGPNTLTVYNASVPGKTFEYPLAFRLDVMVGQIQPDLILMNYGHNEGHNVDPAQVRERTLQCVETLRAASPNSAVIIMSQNPRTDVATTPANIEGIRAIHFRKIAQMMGYGFVDVHQAFVDAGNVAGLLSDGLHPNLAGSRLWADKIKEALTYNKSAGQNTAPAPAFLTPGVNLLPNGDFKLFASPPTLTNWTATNCTLSKNTTNRESSNGYAVRMQSATTGQAYMKSGGLNYLLLGGQTITFAARVRIPSGQGGNVGRVSINIDGTSYFSRGAADARDGFFWINVTARVPKTGVGNLDVTIWLNTDTAVADITVDRAVLVLGQVPRDLNTLTV